MTKEFIQKKLLEIGVPAGYLGFYYITDYLMLTEGLDISNVKMAWVYYDIAKKHGRTYAGVERAIRNAFSFTRKHAGTNENVKHYIGLDNIGSRNTLEKFRLTLHDDWAKEKGGDALG